MFIVAGGNAAKLFQLEKMGSKMTLLVQMYGSASLYLSEESVKEAKLNYMTVAFSYSQTRCHIHVTGEIKPKLIID
jgi:sulfur relay (sulfurtransferase) DsrF/TusC family protein